MTWLPDAYYGQGKRHAWLQRAPALPLFPSDWSRWPVRGLPYSWYCEHAVRELGAVKSEGRTRIQSIEVCFKEENPQSEVKVVVDVVEVREA